MKKYRIGVKLLSLFLSCTLVLMGCGNALVVKDKNPMITKSEPVSTMEKTQSAKVYFLQNKFLPEAKVYPALSFTKNYTFFQAQERFKKEGGDWQVFKNTERVILRNYGVKKGNGIKKSERNIYGPGYVEPGHLFLAKLLREDENGNRVYQVRYVGQCGNEIPLEDELLVVVIPVIMTKNIATNTTIEYNNIDHKWTLIAGIAGILIGLGLGHMFWAGRTIVAAAGCIGGPAPVPVVP